MNAIEKLAAGIAYPEAVPAGADHFTFTADEADIEARETGGRIILEHVLWRAAEPADPETERIPGQLACFAAGRILREEATLAWDPKRDAAILWQDAPASLPPEKLRRLFELFAVSCDWWRERVTEATTPEPVFPEMMIRP